MSFQIAERHRFCRAKPAPIPEERKAFETKAMVIKMKITCVLEHNGDDSLLYAVEYVGAYTRGESEEVTLSKMKGEIEAYARWLGEPAPESVEAEIIARKSSTLAIKDADSDVIFESEREELTADEYKRLKTIALKSAEDFLALYESIPDKNAVAAPPRRTFYGQVPRSANEMYEHTKRVNEYYFSEIGADADNEGSIVECRKRGFEAIEAMPDFLQNRTVEGSYGEEWSLRKVLRRFIWHDRIHAKAMYKTAKKLFPDCPVASPFHFEEK